MSHAHTNTRLAALDALKATINNIVALRQGENLSFLDVDVNLTRMLKNVNTLGTLLDEDHILPIVVATMPFHNGDIELRPNAQGRLCMEDKSALLDLHETLADVYHSLAEPVCA